MAREMRAPAGWGSAPQLKVSPRASPPGKEGATRPTRLPKGRLAFAELPAPTNGHCKTVKIVHAWLHKTAQAAESALLERRTARRARCAGTSDPDGPNLLMSALRPSSWPLAGPISHDQAGAPLVVARILQLPLWPALGVTPPLQCKHCGSAATSATHVLEGGEASSTLRSARSPERRPAMTRLGGAGIRSSLDDLGDHITACPSAGPMAGAKARHDALTRELARISAAVGRDGAYHDGLPFQFGSRLRPADFMELGHVCVDVSIGARQVLTAAAREAGKRRKYAPHMAVNPSLVFQPFCIDLDGDVGPETAQLMASWAAALAAVRRRAGVPPGDPRGDVNVAVARAFTRGMTSQIRTWSIRYGRGIA